FTNTIALLNSGLRGRPCVATRLAPKFAFLGATITHDFFKSIKSCDRHYREHEPERDLISSYVKIAIQSMEEPQSGIGRMIQALLFSLGKQVGNETITHIVRERAKNIA